MDYLERKIFVRNIYKRASAREGFTLVELIVVIAILGILAGIAIPVYSQYISKANEAADYQQLDAIKTAVMFSATDAAMPDPATVTGITVGTDSNGAVNSVTYTTKEGLSGDDIADSATIITQIGSTPVFKSNKFKGGASWDGEKWN